MPTHAAACLTVPRTARSMSGRRHYLEDVARDVALRIGLTWPFRCENPAIGRDGNREWAQPAERCSAATLVAHIVQAEPGVLDTPRADPYIRPSTAKLRRRGIA
jgi:hypothetical protein